MAGNVTSQIWLGKNYLGQRDFSRTEIANPDGSPVGRSHQDFAAEVIEQIRGRHAKPDALGATDPGPEADGAWRADPFRRR